MDASSAYETTVHANSIGGVMDRIYIGIKAHARSGMQKFQAPIPNKSLDDVVKHLESNGYTTHIGDDLGKVTNLDIYWGEGG